MVRYGAHAFVWIGDWATASGNDTIYKAAESGFDFIEIPLLKPETFDAESHRRALDEAGIYAVCSLALPKGVHMPENPAGAKRFLLAVLDKLETLGSTYLAGCIGYSLGALTGAPPTAGERQVIVDTLREVAVEAEMRGVTLALEACNRYETHLYNTLQDTREAVLAVGAPNLKLHADTCHMNIEEEGFYTPFVGAADVLDYVHMSESHRGLVGSGTVNWDEAFRGLRAADFSGSLVLESFAAINPDLAAATCLWRPAKHPPEVLASEGLAFLKDRASRAGLA